MAGLILARRRGRFVREQRMGVILGLFGLVHDVLEIRHLGFKLLGLLFESLLNRFLSFRPFSNF
jgi:hypothetical protein